MSKAGKEQVGSFLKGFLVMLFVMALIMLSGLVEPRQAENEGISATGMAMSTSSAPLVARASISCAWESVSTACSSSYCYANKRTADKVCSDKGYAQAMSYTYDDISRSSANRWTGSWTSTTADYSDDVAPKGGGGLASTGGKGSTSTLSYVLCC